jgi:phenolic acid decarboxylase
MWKAVTDVSEKNIASVCWVEMQEVHISEILVAIYQAAYTITKKIVTYLTSQNHKRFCFKVVSVLLLWSEY